MPAAIVSEENRLVVVQMNETATREAILDIVTQTYPKLGERSILWDFRQSDVQLLTEGDFQAIAATASAVLPRGGFRKTAYVVANSADYVKAVKYLNVAAKNRVPAEYNAFTSIEAARAWLAQR